jgi:hypothetical protein
MIIGWIAFPIWWSKSFNNHNGGLVSGASDRPRQSLA